MDEKDRKILEVLKENSNLTTRQISKRTLYPITTVHNRIKKMEERGVIKGYTVLVDHKKLGKDILAFIMVTVNYVLPSGKKITQESVAKKIKKLKGVEEVNITTGETDIIVKVRLGSIDELNEFVVDKLRDIDGIDKTQTRIVLNVI